MHYNGSHRLQAQTQRLDNAARTDLDVLHAQHQFVRDEEEDSKNQTWERRMAMKYYQRLFKEYALADLSRCKEGKVGLRWRTEQEVLAGKGQFTCGNKRCDAKCELHSYELNFAYKENGERKRALVKVRACPECAAKLFYEKIMRVKAQEKKRRKHQRKERNKRKKLRVSGECSPTETDADVTNEDFDGSENVHEMIARMNREKGDGADVCSKHSSSGLDASAPKSDNSQPSLQGTAKAKEQAPENECNSGAAASSVWSAPVEQEKTKDDEYDDFFGGLFM
jgi:protein FRA10AC1